MVTLISPVQTASVRPVETSQTPAAPPGFHWFKCENDQIKSRNKPWFVLF